MSTKPEIPTIYYFYCPHCEVMKDLLSSDFQEFSDNDLSHECSGCKNVYGFPMHTLALDEGTAYRNTVSFLNGMLESQIDQLVDIEERVKNVGAIEVMANSLVYSFNKAFMDILIYAKKGETKMIEGECKEMLMFLEKTNKKSKSNTLVKDLVKVKKNEKKIAWRNTLK